MNKRSIAALALAATMTLGVGASYAWFTSQATSYNNEVQTGTLAINLDDTSKLYPFTLSNLYPGVDGSKTGSITVKNTGSINLLYRVTSTFAGGEGSLYNIANLKVTTTAGKEIFNGKLNELNSALANDTLPVGKSQTLNFTVSLPNDAGNEYQNKTAYINFVFNAAQNINTTDWIGQAVSNHDGSINLNDSPYSYNFSNKNNGWSGSYYSETSIYLDPSAIANGQGFDYTVAMGKPDGSHLRDFIFNLGEINKKLYVRASNNSSNDGRLSVDPNNGTAITEAGWYTFQHRFYNNSGSLAAQLSILDANKNVVFTQTLNDVNDTSYGVPKYSWFTFITVSNGINVQNHRDYIVNP